MAIIFYDPHDEYMGRKSLIIPLNSKKISDEDIFKKSFANIHQCILASCREIGINPGSEVRPEQYQKVINKIQGKIEIKGIISFIKTIYSPVGNAFLGAFVGKIFS